MAEGQLRTEGERRGVRFERRYDASAEELWSALTEPERLARWLADADVELRAGGRFHLTWQNSDGTRTTDTTTIRVLEPHRVLELAWSYPGEPDSIARFELHPDGDGTLLVLDHSGLPPKAIAGYGAGWHSHLDGLEAHLAGKAADWDARFEELGPTYEAQAAAL